MDEPTAYEVAYVFVKTYYELVCVSPGEIHKFYKDSSTVTRPGPDGAMFSFTTMEEIKEHLASSMDCKGSEIHSFDSQYTSNNNGVEWRSTPEERDHEARLPSSHRLAPVSKKKQRQKFHSFSMEWPFGIRFHPTDVELLKIFLKRKVQGKKLSFEAIADLDVYKHAPWDLPHMAILNTGDFRWYFFCPVVKKYAKGNQLNRASDFGCWKATGKDKPIMSRKKKLGMMKTLVFYGGKAAQGVGKDWVIREYRLDDDEKLVEERGIVQDYVSCPSYALLVKFPSPQSMEAPQVADQVPTQVQSNPIDNSLRSPSEIFDGDDEAFNNGDQGNCNFGLEQEAPQVAEEDDISSLLASYQGDFRNDLDFLEQDVTRRQLGDSSSNFTQPIDLLIIDFFLYTCRSLNDVLWFHDEKLDLPKETIVAVEPSLGKSNLDDDFPIVADPPNTCAPVRKFVEKNESQIDQGKSIHVANLAVDVKPEALRQVFKKFGTIRSNGIKIRPNFSSNRCFAFIEFESSISAQSAIQASLL
ncbi:hypothetical protein COLO4_18882 [Corchorus olitorius]|uniref:No apical meristem (NAM) protein n=1 Tax=Corchorus olitorius TaxID=93759 RepID=A0A1R3J7H8_9ROSI|nr:hypothetical protein COLO4_18882 [Corchorus olitorius]